MAPGSAPAATTRPNPAALTRLQLRIRARRSGEVGEGKEGCRGGGAPDARQCRSGVTGIPHDTALQRLVLPQVAVTEPGSAGAGVSGGVAAAADASPAGAGARRQSCDWSQLPDDVLQVRVHARRRVWWRAHTTGTVGRCTCNWDEVHLAQPRRHSDRSRAPIRCCWPPRAAGRVRPPAASQPRPPQRAARVHQVGAVGGRAQWVGQGGTR